MRRQRRPDAGATQRCLNPGFSERIENSRRTTVHGAHKSWTEARGGIECVKEAENGSSTRTQPVRAWRVSGADRSISRHPPSTRGGHNVDTGLDARAGATQVHPVQNGAGTHRSLPANDLAARAGRRISKA